MNIEEMLKDFYIFLTSHNENEKKYKTRSSIFNDLVDNYKILYELYLKKSKTLKDIKEYIPICGCDDKAIDYIENIIEKGE